MKLIKHDEKVHFNVKLFLQIYPHLFYITMLNQCFTTGHLSLGVCLQISFMCVSQAETIQADLRPDQQAKQQITVQPYATFSQKQQNYLYISLGTNTVSVGDRLSLKLEIKTAEQTHRDLIKEVIYLVRQDHHMTVPLQCS